MLDYQIAHHHVLADQYRAKGLWRQKNFYSILSERAAQMSEKTVFIDGDGEVTFAELKLRVEKCAAYFRDVGIRPGDVVTVQLPNRIVYPVVLFALELVGAVINTVNPDFRRRELDYILRFSNSRGFVCAKTFRGFDYLSMGKDLQKGIPELSLLLVSGRDVTDAHDLDAGVENASPIPASDMFDMDPDQVYRMAFTSGTTGDPKCVLHSLNTTLYAVDLVSEVTEATSDDVILIYLPLGLNWGFLTMLQAIVKGCQAVLLEKFSSSAALQAIDKHRISYIPTAPASIVAMLNDPELKKYNTESLRLVITGGASAPLETIRAFQQAMHSSLVELYGMLETGFHTLTRITDDPEKVNGTIGRLVGEMEMQIVDANLQDVPRGQIGELMARGPSVHLGYHNNPSANAQSFTKDGWFRTGDLGKYVDELGNVKLTGREKEIINRGGKKYFPREVEEILYTHPKILHAAVIGVPDERLGERNCLCVVQKAGERISLGEVITFLKGQVADYKLPEFLEIFDDLPLTETGKVRRHILKDQVLARVTGLE